MHAITNPAGAELVAVLEGWSSSIRSKLGEVAAERFQSMMLDTWCRTITRDGDAAFVITGDIPAMWLRDSSAQMLPFLRLVSVAEVQQTLRAIVGQQWRFIALDPYANAFTADPGVWERKYEVDSLTFPVQLAHQLWRATGDTSHLDDHVHEGCRAVVDLWRIEQRHFENSDYRHVRKFSPRDTLGKDGRGTPVAFTGMTWSGFRPSDDACVHGYNIPAQLMAVMALRFIGEFADHWDDEGLRVDAARLAREISSGVDRFAMVDGRFAYEVDGLGGVLCMDDANMPSLLSLPLTSDVGVDDERYQTTRAWVLSPANPFYYRGRHARGIGSPHTPRGYIWHIALAVQGLTGTVAEGRRCLDTILATDGGTGWTHEGFNPNRPTRFTRPWFSWSNSMACELIMRLTGQR